MKLSLHFRKYRFGFKLRRTGIYYIEEDAFCWGWAGFVCQTVLIFCDLAGWHCQHQQLQHFRTIEQHTLPKQTSIGTHWNSNIKATRRQLFGRKTNMRKEHTGTTI
jgi:hypothetical protein